MGACDLRDGLDDSVSYYVGYFAEGSEECDKDSSICDSCSRVGEALRSVIGKGVVEHLLCCAHRDSAWKVTVEALLGKKPLNKLVRISGSRIRDVWDPSSALHRHILKEPSRIPSFFEMFAYTNPVAIELLKKAKGEGEGPGSAEITPEARFLFAFIDPARDGREFARASEALAEHMALAGACSGEFEEDTSTSGDLDEVIANSTALGVELKELKAKLSSKDAEMKKALRELAQNKEALRRKGRAETALRTKIGDLGKEGDELSAKLKEARNLADEQTRSADRLERQLKEERKGREKVAGKREDDQKLIDELRDDVRSLQEVIDQKEREVLDSESRLGEESERRQQLESAFEAFGFDTMESSLADFSKAINLLSTFRNAIDGYVTLQHDEEAVRRAADEERRLCQDEERAAEQSAREAVLQQRESWTIRSEERLADAHSRLFPYGIADNILVDGHNLIFRSRRPESERSTREWLEKMMLEMAIRMEAEGVETRMELVFDTPYAANSHSAGHGLTIHFANNSDGQSGADEKIAQLLRERHPEDRYQIISADRKHVWADAIAQSETNAIEVDLVQVELLAQYLEILQDLVEERA